MLLLVLALSLPYAAAGQEGPDWHHELHQPRCHQPQRGEGAAACMPMVRVLCLCLLCAEPHGILPNAHPRSFTCAATSWQQDQHAQG
jgi:hypothetical protein